MAYTTINTPSDYFKTITYTGTGANNTVSHNLSATPDLVWCKQRSSVNNHFLFDTVRGTTKALFSNLDNAEGTYDSTYLNTLGSSSITWGSSTNINESGQTYVNWLWQGGGTAVSNTNGDITSSVSANTTSGFSIVSWTGSGASNTVGHGLNSPVELIIVKNRTDSVTDWRIGNSFISGQTMADGNGYYLEFDTGAIANPGGQTVWGSPPANPTSTVFKVGSNNSNNGSGDAIIAYCFHSVKGFSKFGSYTGNGSADGTFVYTGFKPAFVIMKRTNTTGEWGIFDDKRNTFNVATSELKANASDADEINGAIDFLSNGFKLRDTALFMNGSGSTYIYMAFAENPFTTSTGIPTTAR